MTSPAWPSKSPASTTSQTSQTQTSPHTHSRGRGYYDIDAILAEHERLTCTFRYPAMDCGPLDPSVTEPDLDTSHRVDLPLWLASALYAEDQVSVDCPFFLSRTFRQTLQAGASSINLRLHCPFFYVLGWKVVPMLCGTQESQEVQEVGRGVGYR